MNLPLSVRVLAWRDGVGSSLADAVYYGCFHNFTVFQVHPFPTPVAFAEERLFFILAVFEMLAAVETVVQDAGQHLADVAACVHHLGRVQIIHDGPQRAALIRLAIGVEAESRVADALHRRAAVHRDAALGQWGVLLLALKSGVVLPLQLGAADVNVLLVKCLDVEAVRLWTLQPEPVAGRGEVHVGKDLGVTRIRFTAEVVVLAQVLAHDEVLHGVFLTSRTGKKWKIGARLLLFLPASERRCARDEAGQHSRQRKFRIMMSNHEVPRFIAKKFGPQEKLHEKRYHMQGLLRSVFSNAPA